jgi:hypothetical protein
MAADCKHVMESGSGSKFHSGSWLRGNAPKLCLKA